MGVISIQMKLKAMGIDATILRESIDIEEKGEESSGLPKCRGQAEKEELSAKKDKNGVARVTKARKGGKNYFKKERMVKYVKHCLKVK